MTKKLAKNIVSFERIGNKYAIVKVTNNILFDWKVLEKKKLTDNDPAMFCAVKGKKIIKDNGIYWKSKRLGHSRKYCFEYIQYLLGKTKIEPEYNPDTKHLSNKFKF